MERRGWQFLELMAVFFWSAGFGPACQPAPLPPRTPVQSVAPTPACQPADTPAPPATERYLADASATGSQLSRALQDLAELLQAARLGDPDWERAARGQVATISQLQQELRHIDVPVELIGIHSDLLSALHGCDVATSFLSYSTINSSDLAIAGEQLMLCRAAFSGRLQTLGERVRAGQ